MTSILKVDTIQDTAGNNIINESSDTITIGASGDTITIPSGATIDLSSATQTGVGGTNTPAFLAHVSGSAFSLPNSTQTKVIFNSEKYDTASAYDTSTALFTVPSGEGGKYFLCSQLFMGGASASRFIMIMRLNSSSNLIYMDGEKTAPCTVFASTVRTLSAGDTVHIEASQNSGSAQDLDYSPTAEVNYFYGYKLIE
jgi:hypothetical protein